MNKKRVYDPNYLIIAVLAVLLYVGFDKLMANVSSNTAREIISAAISVIFVMVTTMYMLKKQTELERLKELDTEILKKKLEIYTRALALWQAIGWDNSEDISENQKKEAVAICLELVMVAPNELATEANSITGDVLKSEEKDKLFRKIGDFSKKARIDLELADLNLKSAQELEKLFEQVESVMEQADTQTGRNYDKFEFNGQHFNKRRLALALVQHVVSKKKIKNIKELKDAFPDAWFNSGKLGGNGVVSIEDNVKDRSRWFVQPNERLPLEDGSFAVVSSQWGANIDYFIRQTSKEYGLSIKKSAKNNLR